jgi:PEP-CTERM motif-containing protein
MRSRVTVRGALSGALVVMAFTASPVRADPVRIVAGVAQLEVGAGTDAIFDLLTADAAYAGQVFGDEPGITVTAGVVPRLVSGSRFDFSSEWNISFAHDEGAMGLNHWKGRFSFRAGSGTLTCEDFPDSTMCEAVALFDFAGVLTGFDRSGSAVLRRDLVGRGTSAGIFDSLRASGFPILQYSFDDAATVPEPATVLLTGAGLATLIRRRRR